MLLSGDKLDYKRFVEEFEIAESDQTKMREKWEKYLRMYKGFLSSDYPYQNISKMAMVAFQSIMPMASRILGNIPKIQYIMNSVNEQVLKSPEDRFDFEEKVEIISDDSDADRSVKLNNPQTDEQKRLAYNINRFRSKSCSIMNMIVDDQWDRTSATRVLRQVLVNSMIYGTAILYESWDKEKNCFSIKNVSPFSFFPSQYCDDPFYLDDHFFFRRVWLSESQFREKVESGEFDIGDKTVESFVKETNDDMNRIKTAVNMTDSATAKWVEIIEYYDKHQIVTVANRRMIVKDSKNKLGFIPFKVFSLYKIPGIFWGMGVIEVIEQEIEDITDFRAIRKENFEYSVNSMFYANMEAEIYPEDLVSRPGQIIRGYGEKAITPIQRPALDPNIFNEEQIRRQSINYTTGQNDIHFGIRTPGEQTATEINALDTTANFRWDSVLQDFTIEILVPLGKDIVELNKTFLKPFDIVLDIQDDKGRYLKFKVDNTVLKNIKTDYTVKASVGSVKNTTKREILELFQYAISVPTVAERLKMDKFLDRVLETFDIPAYDLVKSDDDVIKEREQMMQMQQMMQAGGQNGQANTGNPPAVR